MYKVPNQVVNTCSKLTDGFIMFLSVQRHVWDLLNWASLRSRTCCKETKLFISPKYPHKYNNKTIQHSYKMPCFLLFYSVGAHQPLDTLSYFKSAKLGPVHLLEVTWTEEGLQEWSCSHRNEEFMILTIFWVKTQTQRRNFTKHGLHNLNQAVQVTLRLYKTQTSKSLHKTVLRQVNTTAACSDSHVSTRPGKASGSLHRCWCVCWSRSPSPAWASRSRGAQSEDNFPSATNSLEYCSVALKHDVWRCLDIL